MVIGGRRLIIGSRELSRCVEVESHAPFCVQALRQRDVDEDDACLVYRVLYADVV